jgi:membrane-anchored mycosin MYCP
MTTAGPRQAKDQIVVANAHVGVVLPKLQELVSTTEPERSDELGLTLIDLNAAAVAARALEIRTANPDVVRDAGQVVAGGPSADLSVVIGDLYRQFVAAYSGWVPIMGTNRVVVGPAHNINGGGQGDPRPSDGPLLRPSAELGAFVRVGMADTALYFHQMLDGSCLAPRDHRWAATAATAPVASGHGTFVAGLILQQAPGATVVATQILDESGEADSWDVAKALVRFARAGIQVLNLSIECSTADNAPPLVLSTAIDRLGWSVQVVAAAGNHNPTDAAGARRPVWPAAFDDVLAVAAHDANDAIPDWSTTPELPWVDCVASGVDVVSTFPPLILSDVQDGIATVGDKAEDSLVSWSGTSFAAATVTGLIAAEMGSTGADARAATARLLRDARRLSGLPCLD